MVLNKKTIEFRSKKQVMRRIEKLKKVKRRLIQRLQKKDSTNLRRSLRNVIESISQLRSSRRILGKRFGKFVKSIKIFTV